MRHPLDSEKAYRAVALIGRAVARGDIPYESARASVHGLAFYFSGKLVNFCPLGLATRLMHHLHDTARAQLEREARAERFISSAVWPLCEARAPGNAILAAAERANAGVLPPDEVTALCRSIAARSLRRGR